MRWARRKVDAARRRAIHRIGHCSEPCSAIYAQFGGRKCATINSARTGAERAAQVTSTFECGRGPVARVIFVLSWPGGKFSGKRPLGATRGGPQDWACHRPPCRHVSHSCMASIKAKFSRTPCLATGSGQIKHAVPQSYDGDCSAQTIFGDQLRRLASWRRPTLRHLDRRNSCRETS
jgi:hypothetical protein